MHVREFSQDSAGAYANVRGIAASFGFAGDAADDSASPGASGGSAAGTTWGDAGDGQHESDADAGDHEACGLGFRAARGRPARTADTVVVGGGIEAPARAAGLGEGAIAAPGEVGEAEVGEPFAAHASRNRNR